MRDRRALSADPTHQRLHLVEEGVDDRCDFGGFVAAGFVEAQRQVAFAGNHAGKRLLDRCGSQRGAVLRRIEAEHLVAGADPQRHDRVDRPEGGVAGAEGEGEDCGDADRLHLQLVEHRSVGERGGIREEDEEQRTRRAADAVHRDSADGVIQLHHPQDESLAGNDQQAADRADHRRSMPDHDVAARRDPDEARQQPVDRARRHVVAVDRAPGEHADRASEGCGDDRVEGDPSDVADAGDRRAAVEADPADEEDDRPGAGQHHRVTGDRAGVSVFVESPEARPEHDQRGHRHPCADGVDHRRSREIDEAHPREPGLVVRNDRTAPGPVTDDRVDQSRDDRRDQEVAAEHHSLCDRAGDDGRRRADEHRLEHEQAEHPGVPVDQRLGVGEEPDHAADARAEHQAEADEIEEADGKKEIAEVLLGHVDGVLRAHHPRLEQQEPGLHGQHQRSRRDDPDVVQRHLRCIRGGGEGAVGEEGDDDERDGGERGLIHEHDYPACDRTTFSRIPLT